MRHALARNPDSARLSLSTNRAARQRGAAGITIALIVLMVAAAGFATVELTKSSFEVERQQTSRDALGDIVSATKGYARSYLRLPCPDTDGDGQENRDAPGGPTADCTAADGHGQLPWKTLGLAENTATDQWDNIARYGVPTALTETQSIDEGITVNVFHSGDACGVDSEPHSFVAISMGPDTQLYDNPDTASNTSAPYCDSPDVDGNGPQIDDIIKGTEITEWRNWLNCESSNTADECLSEPMCNSSSKNWTWTGGSCIWQNCSDIPNEEFCSGGNASNNSSCTWTGSACTSVAGDEVATGTNATATQDNTKHGTQRRNVHRRTDNNSKDEAYVFGKQKGKGNSKVLEARDETYASCFWYNANIDARDKALRVYYEHQFFPGESSEGERKNTGEGYVFGLVPAVEAPVDAQGDVVCGDAQGNMGFDGDNMPAVRLGVEFDILDWAQDPPYNHAAIRTNHSTLHWYPQKLNSGPPQWEPTDQDTVTDYPQSSFMPPCNTPDDTTPDQAGCVHRGGRKLEAPVETWLENRPKTGNPAPTFVSGQAARRYPVRLEIARRCNSACDPASCGNTTETNTHRYVHVKAYIGCDNGKSGEGGCADLTTAYTGSTAIQKELDYCMLDPALNSDDSGSVLGDLTTLDTLHFGFTTGDNKNTGASGVSFFNVSARTVPQDGKTGSASFDRVERATLGYRVHNKPSWHWDYQGDTIDGVEVHGQTCNVTSVVRNQCGSNWDWCVTDIGPSDCSGVTQPSNSFGDGDYRLAVRYRCSAKDALKTHVSDKGIAGSSPTSLKVGMCGDCPDDPFFCDTETDCNDEYGDDAEWEDGRCVPD